MSDGKPILTGWRYGLGRIVALTTDDGSNWAPEIYASPSSKMISSMVNWAIGDPRLENDRVEAEDGWMGTPLDLTITSDARPAVPGAEVEKVGDKRYLATFTPNSTGVYYVGQYGIAVNYPLEYRHVGFNPDLERMIITNGGKVFTEDEARQSLVAEAEVLSQKIVQERISRRNLLLILALVIFLAEVIYRRMGEIRRQRRSKT
jgi:hypothetical protein